MSSRRQGGTGPTASLMKVDRVAGTIGFTTRDEADGARVTKAPSYYERHERWKQNLSEEDFKALLWCILPQHFNNKTSYKIDSCLVQKIKCPDTFSSAELRWLQQRENYDLIRKQVHSNYLYQLLNSKNNS